MDIERRTKVSKLTHDNVRAVRDYADLLGAVEVTATTASFAGTPEEACRVFFTGQDEVGRRSPYGRRGGAYKALHAVGRKLRAQLGKGAEERVRRAGDPDAVDEIQPQPTPARGIPVFVVTRHPDFANETRTFGLGHVEEVSIDLGSSFDVTKIGPDDAEELLEWVGAALVDDVDRLRELGATEAADYVEGVVRDAVIERLVPERHDREHWTDLYAARARSEYRSS